MGLNTFTDTTRAHDALRGTAVTNLSPPEVVMATTRPIYPKEAGMIPNYTGHVPGYKFRFGHTYGQGTVAATPGMGLVAMPIAKTELEAIFDRPSFYYLVLIRRSA